MGYAFYTLADGREAGYGVKDVCNEEGCTEKIDRGLAYLCGDDPHGDEQGCTGYFCYAHLFYSARTPKGTPQLCGRCLAALEAAEAEDITEKESPTDVR
jgi:hypothetical protein